MGRLTVDQTVKERQTVIKTFVAAAGAALLVALSGPALAKTSKAGPAGPKKATAPATAGKKIPEKKPTPAVREAPKYTIID